MEPVESSEDFLLIMSTGANLNSFLDPAPPTIQLLHYFVHQYPDLIRIHHLYIISTKVACADLEMLMTEPPPPLVLMSGM